MQNSENAAALIGRSLMSLILILGRLGQVHRARRHSSGLSRRGLPMVEGAWVSPWLSNWVAA